MLHERAPRVVGHATFRDTTEEGVVRLGLLYSGVDRDERARLRTVFARYPGVGGVWLFGSRARSEQTLRSDLDLAIDPHRCAAMSVRARRLDLLTDLVEAGFEDVDLVILDRDDPVLRFEALAPNDLVYAAPGYDAGAAFAKALREHDDSASLRAIVRTAFYDTLLRP